MLPAQTETPSPAAGAKSKRYAMMLPRNVKPASTTARRKDQIADGTTVVDRYFIPSSFQLARLAPLTRRGALAHCVLRHTPIFTILERGELFLSPVCIYVCVVIHNCDSCVTLVLEMG